MPLIPIGLVICSNSCLFLSKQSIVILFYQFAVHILHQILSKKVTYDHWIVSNLDLYESHLYGIWIIGLIVQQFLQIFTFSLKIQKRQVLGGYDVRELSKIGETTLIYAKSIYLSNTQCQIMLLLCFNLFLGSNISYLIYVKTRTLSILVSPYGDAYI